MTTIIRGDRVVTVRPVRTVGYVQRSPSGLAVYDEDHEYIGTARNYDQALIAVEIAAGLRPAPCPVCGSTETVTVHHPTILDQSVDLCAQCGSDA